MRVFFKRDKEGNINLVLQDKHNDEVPYFYNGISFERKAITYDEIADSYKELNYFKEKEVELQEIKSNDKGDSLVFFDNGDVLLIHFTIRGYGVVEQIISVFEKPNFFSSKQGRNKYKNILKLFSSR